ncbi:glycoside hydrolase family protein [Cyanobacterium aponinum FACHB-4101]|uniref:glycoside hydrolase family protein n=1 Tax=Cyanobacterium aponinum TaxID=379064 RepID=UPI0016812220|nr:glycoside hydrolase family protein [Cyanobacterium aponinum]MBD2394608.1 glycoside hydrolase family protein [Cyanobacterium aponinum FACHB-4101]
MSLKNIQTKHLSELTSEQIKELQLLLNNCGYGLIVDGILGPRTEKAFNSFKKQNFLEYPNIIGKTTIEKLLQFKPKKRQVNQAGMELIKEFEGFRRNAYLCPAGVWTIGYGSTFYPDKRKVQKGDVISNKEAEELLKITVNNFADEVDRLITVPINDNQFSALVSFTFNVGVYAFKNSTLRRVLNQGNYQEAANQLLRWNKAGGKTLAGLTRRRQAERNLFLS